jgi:hypothetical protein
MFARRSSVGLILQSPMNRAKNSRVYAALCIQTANLIRGQIRSNLWFSTKQEEVMI